MSRAFFIHAATGLMLLPLAACVSTPTAEPAPAVAATPPATATPQPLATQKPADTEDGLQCKTVVTTGSRLSKKKVCTTAAERERMAAAAKDFLDNSSRGNDAIAGGQ